MQRSKGTNIINLMLTTAWVLVGVTLANVSRAESPLFLQNSDSPVAVSVTTDRSVTQH